MSDPDNTTPEMLCARPRSAGGTACATSTRATCPGRVGDLENTRCHRCRALLVERYGYFVQQVPDHARRSVPRVRHAIPGAGAQFDGQIAATPFLPAAALRTL